MEHAQHAFPPPSPYVAWPPPPEPPPSEEDTEDELEIDKILGGTSDDNVPQRWYTHAGDSDNKELEQELRTMT